MTAINPHTMPAMRPPPGQVTDFNSPHNLHGYLIGTVAASMVVTTFTVASRTFVKAWVVKCMDVEDYLLLFAQAALAAFNAVIVLASEAGQGKHQWDVPIANAMTIARLANILEILSCVVMLPAKLAILIQIKRVFVVQKTGFIYYSTIGLMIINCLAFVGYIFPFIFACWPREKIWNHAVAGTCVSPKAIFISGPVFTFVIDFAMVLIPILGIKRLQVSFKRKLAISSVFAVGFFACLAAVLRLVYSVKLIHTQDQTWAIAPVGMWTIAESAALILVVCCPSMPRFFRHIFGNNKTQDTEAAVSRPTKGQHINLDSQEELWKGAHVAGDRPMYNSANSANSTTGPKMAIVVQNSFSCVSHPAREARMDV